MERRRLLIASPFPHFLNDCAAILRLSFDVQRANSEDVVNFLGKEWQPQILIVDGDSILFNSINKFRSRFDLNSLGLVVVTREMTMAREERAFRAGADQVIIPPNSPETFCLRIQALGVRVGPKSETGTSSPSPNQIERLKPYELGALKILPDDHLVKRNDQILPLTPIQFKLLILFLRKKEQLLTRAEIKEQIWPTTEISLRSIDAQISKLRKIVPELDPHILNIYGKGYVFTESRQSAAS